MSNKLKNLNKRPNVYISKIKLHIYKLHQNIKGIYFSFVYLSVKNHIIISKYY